MTWRELITLTLQELRVYGAATPVGREDEDLALAALNDWIDALKTQGLSVYQQARTTWNLSSAASFTIGIGATINVARPVTPAHIAAFAFQNTALSPVMEFPLGPPLTPSQYQGITAKALTNTYPNGFYYEPTYDASGFGTVYPWPLVTGSLLQGVIYSAVPVDEVTNIAATIALPPGYRRLMRKQLALEIANAFRVPITDDMRLQAKEALADVKRVNQRLDDVSFGVAGHLFGGNALKSNVYTGDV